MTNELETLETNHSQDSVPAGTTAVAVDLTTPAARKPPTPPWERRRYQIAALVLAVAVAAAAIANSVLARQYTADGAVRAYLGALQAGDAANAWTQIQVSPPTTPATFTLTDRAALQAALSRARPDIKSFDISSTRELDSATSTVSASVKTTAGTTQVVFQVRHSADRQYGVYPLWHVIVAPALVQVSLPKGSNGISVDGMPLALPAGTQSTVAVLPIAHTVQFTGTQMLAAQTVAVGTLFSLGQQVPYQPQLTAAGLGAARAAVKTAFANCTQVTSKQPGGCPQIADSSIFIDSGQWQLVGDPTQDLAIRFDNDLNVTAAGHYQMVFAYQESSWTGTRHSPVGGSFRATLLLTATNVSVTSLQAATGLPALQRPAGATDQAAKDLVAKALQACAAVQAQNVSDCPQELISAGATNVRWSLSGDPLAGATVNFDQDSGLVTVHGKFQMSVTYTWLGIAESGSSDSTAYMAYLFWDGQQLQLATIQGLIS